MKGMFNVCLGEWKYWNEGELGWGNLWLLLMMIILGVMVVVVCEGLIVKSS